MAQSSYPPLVNPMAIISPEFCAPYAVHLTKNNGGFTAINVDGNVMFWIEGRFFTLNGRHILPDAAGNPFLTLQHKGTRNWWEVFWGDSTDLLFSVEISTQSDVHVFLAANTEEDVCYFKIRGKWSDQCIISRVHGNSSKIIAQKGKNENDIMTVYPNVNCAFIVALVLVLEKIHDERRHHHRRP